MNLKYIVDTMVFFSKPLGFAPKPLDPAPKPLDPAPKPLGFFSGTRVLKSKPLGLAPKPFGFAAKPFDPAPKPLVPKADTLGFAAGMVDPVAAMVCLRAEMDEFGAFAFRLFPSF